MLQNLMKPAAALLALIALLCGCGKSAPDGAEAEGEAAAGTGLEVYCFSAGKADAFLLYTEGSAVLIDCGEKGFGKEILARLEEAGIESLDYLIITHFDKDHVGGAAKVINNIPVGAVLQSNCPKDSEEYEKYLTALANAGIEPVTVRESMAFTLDGVAYTVDPPRKEDYNSDDSNNSSLIVSVKNGENDLLFMADAQNDRIAEFLATDRTDYDFLKFPYHGHWQETLPELIASVKPEYTVITSSEAEPEDAETLSLLKEAGAAVYLTRNGPILLHCDGTDIQIRSAAETGTAA